MLKISPIHVRKKTVAMTLAVFIGFVGAVFILYTFVLTTAPKEYSTLNEIEQYAQSLDELVKPDNGDWNNPKFDSLFAQRGNAIFGSALRHLGLFRPPAWDVHFLGKLIHQQTAKNNAHNVGNGKNSVVLLKAIQPLTILVFGDLFGAFHSLVRDLRHLQQQNLLSEDLTLKNETTFLIFNGNAINRSAYSIDTLILITLLMKQNPSQVIYVAGTHERDIRWKNYSLANELRFRGWIHSEQGMPLDYELTRFFDSLPSAVYVAGKSDERDVIRIAHAATDELSFNEQSISMDNFLAASMAQVIEVKGEHSSHMTGIDVRATIKSSDWRHGNRISRGVGMLEADNGATTWAVFSSPTVIHRGFLNFDIDAFMAISVDDRVVNASFKTIHNEPEKSARFIEDSPLNLISGSSEPYKNNALMVGSSLSLESGIPTTGRQLKAGMSTAINAFNRNAIQTHDVRLIVSNDNYSPRLARQNTSAHLARGVRSFLLSLGTPTLAAYLDLIKDKSAVVFFPQTGSSLLRAPQFTNLVHYLSSYEDEARALVKEVKQEYGARKFAIFYQADAFGNGPFEAAVKELKSLGVTDIIPLPYTRGIMSFESMAEEIIRKGPDALGFFSVGTSTKEFVRQVGVSVLQSLDLFGLSSVGEIPMRRFFAQKGLHVLYGSAVPNPHTSTLPIANEYRDAMKRDDNIIDVFSFEAYIATKLFLEAMNKTGREQPTAFEIMREIEKMKDLNFHGLKFNFNPKTRSLATEVYIESNQQDVWKKYPL